MKKRILSLVLAVSLCTSLLVAPACADGISFDELERIIENLTIPVGGQEFDVGQLEGYIIPSESVWAGNYTTVTYDILENAVFQLQYLNPQVTFSISPISLHRPSSSTSSTESGYYGVRVIIPYTYAVYWLTNGNGKALVARPASSDITTINSIPRSQAASVGAYRMLSYEDLYNLAYDYNNQHNYKLALNTDGVYWAISSRGDYVLANESGLPYGAVGPSSITSGGSRPDVTTNEDHIIDWLNNTVGSNDGVYGFDNVLYDSNNKTYYIDNSVSYQNSFNQTYYYNWSYTYNIDYTSITYIGSSAEYTETYECYYQLPDGRSSADLTKEDLEQLNLSMDVVEYQRSADDTRLRSLYHFDGNTEDASYWNYATSFDWTFGASLTYLESNAFNGCLYLDELAHDFTISLPSSLGSGDFTVDFRYYQSATETPHNDSYIKIGGHQVLRLDGSHFIFNGINYATPVGNWQHLAFVRKDGTLFFYLNGVRQGSKAFSNVLSSAVQFYFDADQQTYKYLDELRVTNFAVWENNFTPATVPYDTNLSLVLPTDSVPVADEYWDISCYNNLLSQYNLDWWDNQHGNTGILSNHFSSASVTSGTDPLKIYVDKSLASYSLVSHFGYFTELPSWNSFTAWALNGTYNLTDTTVFTPSGPYLFGGWNECVYNGLTIPLYFTWDDARVNTVFTPAGKNMLYSYFPYSSFVLSMVSSNGEVGSYSFNLSEFVIPNVGSLTSGTTYCFYSDQTVFNGYILSVMYSCSYSKATTFNSVQASLCIIPTSYAGEFVYLALEPGTESTVTAEFVSGVAGIPADDLNTPTLAVRSDIPMPVSSGSFGGGRDGSESTTGFNNLKSYQIGGVRPTFAERGFVYAMVESGFITSLQQYTGYAWQAVDGRIWTGSRWIPYSSYNVITLSDMYDIADASGQSGYEYIYSETGFWSWWQKQWLEFKQWYTNVEFTVSNSFDYTNEKIKQTVNNVFMSIGEINTQIEEKIETTFNIDIDIGTGQSNSLGLLSFVQKVFGDLTSGLGGFTSTYLSPDDSLDVIFVPPPPPPPPPEELE